MSAAVLFALVSALAYGTADFVGGILSKTRSVWMVATAGQMTAALATAVVALFVPGDPEPADFVWAAVAGLGGGIGVAFLYRGLSRGRMGVVAPISGIGAAFVPVAVGLGSGEAPSLLAWVGIVVALPAIYLVPKAPEEHEPDEPTPASGGLTDGVIAGLGFGALFALIEQIGDEAGLLPLSVVSVGGAATVVVMAGALGQPWLPRGLQAVPVLALGPLSAAGLVFFLLATGQGLLTIVSVIASLYPAGTVALSAVVLREKLGRLQSVGLGLTAVAVVLFALG